MGKGARHWLRYLNREGLVLLLRDLVLESETLKGELAEQETVRPRGGEQAGADTAETPVPQAEPESEPIMIEEIYGWKPETDAFGPDDAWSGQKDDPSKAVRPTSAEGRAE